MRLRNEPKMKCPGVLLRFNVWGGGGTPFSDGLKQGDCSCPDLSLLGISLVLGDIPDFFVDVPDLSFASFSAYQKDLEGTLLKGSGTQSGPSPRNGNAPVYLLSSYGSDFKKELLVKRPYPCNRKTYMHLFLVS